VASDAIGGATCLITKVTMCEYSTLQTFLVDLLDIYCDQDAVRQ